MTVGALVERAILSVVTSIVAKKTLGGWCGGRSEKHPGQGLGRRRDDPSSLGGGLGGGTAQEGIFLREPEFWYKGFSRGRWPGGDLRG